MKSHMNASQRFAATPRLDIPRSSFDRTHTVKTTFDTQYLVPVLVDEIVPGDTFNLRTQFFGRLSTPLYPTMDNFHVELFAFFVPHRLVSDEFKRMMGEQTSPGASTDFTVPQITAASHAEGSLYDHFGIPTQTGTAIAHSNLKKIY